MSDERSDATFDRDAARSGAGAADGPRPGGVDETESPSPAGAVVGEVGLAGTEPGAGDLGGGGDLGADTGVEHDDEPGGPDHAAG